MDEEIRVLTELERVIQKCIVDTKVLIEMLRMLGGHPDGNAEVHTQSIASK